MTQSERSLNQLPKWLILLLPITIALQITWHQQTNHELITAEELPSPPASHRLQLLSLNEPQLLSRLSMLWLQAFDKQPGISLSFKQLDYGRLITWLDTALELDPQSHYPLFAASHVYAQINDLRKKRQITDFIRDKFLEQPNKRWRWMANSVIVAKHELKDLALAADYASELRRFATGADVPSWAQQMEIFLLEDMGEYERAQLLLGALLSSGEISDANELRFLNERLKQLQGINLDKH